MNIQLDSVSALRSSLNHWTHFFREHPCEKVRLLRYVPEACPEDPRFTDGLKKFQEWGTVRSGSLGLMTYLGWGLDPFGWWYRSLDRKSFVDYLMLPPAVYLTQACEDQWTLFRHGHPIVLLEGVLDAEVAQWLSGYPFVMSYLTNHVPQKTAAFLSLFTNKFIVVPDSDHWGMQHAEKSLSAFRRARVSCRVLLNPQEGDLGDVFVRNNLEEQQTFRTRLNHLITTT